MLRQAKKEFKEQLAKDTNTNSNISFKYTQQTVSGATG